MAVAPANTTLAPQNIEAEESVLGAMLIAGETAISPVVIDVRLHADDFYRDSHRAVYRAIISLYNKSEAVDVLTVCAELEERGELEEAGGKAYVHQLAAAVPAAGNVRYYGDIVKGESKRRRLLDVAYKIVGRVTER